MHVLRSMLSSRRSKLLVRHRLRGVWLLPCDYQAERAMCTVDVGRRRLEPTHELSRSVHDIGVNRESGQHELRYRSDGPEIGILEQVDLVTAMKMR
jgi:hypothetical protein